MPSKRRHEGYLLIDHRNSPGVSAEMIRACHKPLIGGTGMFESSTITCAHCHVVVVLNPDRSRPRGYCAKCDHYVCDNAGCNSECLPMKKVLDDLQEQAALDLQRGSIIIAKE